MQAFPLFAALSLDSFVEQQFFAAFFAVSPCAEQHDFFGVLCSTGSSSAAASTNFGGVTPCFFAQAIFSRLLRQQQLFQHCAADMQPQMLSWQGKGAERSFCGA